MAKSSTTASFDHPVAAREQRCVVFEIPDGNSGGHRRIEECRRFALLQIFECLGGDAASRSALRREVQQDDLQTGIRQVRRDARAHGAGAEYGGLSDESGRHAAGRCGSGRRRLGGKFSGHWEDS
jgi:hypothetical protein